MAKHIWFVNPFERIAGWGALVIGLIAILFAGFIGSLSNTHFDGVLDVHSGLPADIWVFLVTGIINWLVMGIILLIFGKFVSPCRFRIRDLFGTQAFARIPTLLIALVLLSPTHNKIVEGLITNQGVNMWSQFSATELFVFFLTVSVVLLGICWMVYWMYKGYSVSCNIRGGKAIGSFIGGLIGAEAASKVLFLFLMGSLAQPHLALGEQKAKDPIVENSVKMATQAATSWLEVVDAGDYAASWGQTAQLFQKAVTQSQWEAAAKSVRTPLGTFTSREVISAQYMTSIPGVGEGKFVVIQFKAVYENKEAIETVTPMLENGEWKVSGYYVR